MPDAREAANGTNASVNDAMVITAVWLYQHRKLHQQYYRCQFTGVFTYAHETETGFSHTNHRISFLA